MTVPAGTGIVGATDAAGDALRGTTTREIDEADDRRLSRRCFVLRLLVAGERDSSGAGAHGGRNQSDTHAAGREPGALLSWVLRPVRMRDYDRGLRFGVLQRIRGRRCGSCQGRAVVCAPSLAPSTLQSQDTMGIDQRFRDRRCRRQRIRVRYLPRRRLPYFCLNRSTRPPLLTTRCCPV